MKLSGFNWFIGLACRDQGWLAPFNTIECNQSHFINAEYVPNGVQLTAPWAMKHNDLEKLFMHIASHEVSHGLQNAYRFKAILSSWKQEILLTSQYNDDDPEPVSVPMVLLQKSRKDRGKSKEVLTQTEPAPVQDMESSSGNTSSNDSSLVIHVLSLAPVTVHQSAHHTPAQVKEKIWLAKIDVMEEIQITTETHTASHRSSWILSGKR